MKHKLLTVLLAITLTGFLSSCSFTKSCHATFTLNPPAIQLACDSSLLSVIEHGGSIIIPKTLLPKATKLKASFAKQQIDVVVKYKKK